MVSVMLFSVCFSHAETIKFKNGKTIEAKVMEKTEQYIKVDISGIPITYYLNEIESIDGKAVSLSPEATSSGAVMDKLSTQADDYFREAEKYYSQGNYDQAIANYNKAIQINPNDAKVYVNRGVAYASRCNYDQAIADFDKALQIDSNFAGGAGIYYNRGVAYHYKKDYDKAWEDIHRAEKLGFKSDPEILAELKKASGREK